MHVHTVRTKYTFGDRVRYQSRSPFNGSGTGTIIGINFDQSGWIDYLIEVDGSRDIQGGICDDEITLLTDDTGTATPTRV